MKQKPIATVDDPKVIKYSRELRETFKKVNGFYEGSGKSKSGFAGVYTRGSNGNPYWEVSFTLPPYLANFADSSAGNMPDTSNGRAKKPSGARYGRFKNVTDAATFATKCIDDVYTLVYWLNNSRCDTDFVAEEFVQESDVIDVMAMIPSPAVVSHTITTGKLIEAKEEFGRETTFTQLFASNQEWCKNLLDTVGNTDINLTPMHQARSSGGIPDIIFESPFGVKLIVEVMELGKELDRDHVIRAPWYADDHNCRDVVLLVDNPKITPKAENFINHQNENSKFYRIWVLQTILVKLPSGENCLSLKVLLSPPKK